MKYLFAGVIASLSLLLVMGQNDAGEKAKHTIPQVMAKAMKGGLCKKVVSGKASDEEKQQLVDMFTSLNKNEPPKGDLKAWQKRTGDMVAAAKKIAAGDTKAAKVLAGLANCKTCHDQFRE